MPDAQPPAKQTSWLISTLIFIALVTLYRGLVVYFGHLDLYVDEAQYWTWAQDLSWGYYSKPPVLALLIAFTTWIGGNGVFWVKAGSLLCYPISALLIYALTKRLFDARTAFWSAVAFLLLPGVSLSSMIISTDVPFFVFWCLALYAYWRALEDDAWGWWLLAGVAGGAGLQSKYTMILFVPAVVLHLATDTSLRRHLKNPKLYATLALAAVIFLPNLVWNATHGWPSLHNVTDASHLGSNPGLHWNSLGDFFGAQFGVMGPVFFGAWLWFTLIKPGRWWRNPPLRFLNLFAWVFLGVICLVALGGNAYANWGAMAFASATVFIVAMLLTREGGGSRTARWCFGIGLAINFIVMPLAYHLDWWTQKAGITLNAHNDLYKRVRGWSQFGVQAGRFLDAHPNAIPLGDNRTVVAELKYYDRPRGRATLEWNPSGQVLDQYTLEPTLAGMRGHDFVYISPRNKLTPQMQASFAGTRKLGHIHIPIHADFSRDYNVWLLKDFRGYQSPPAVPEQADTSVQ
ncbi:MAG: glycosyltransferase family 39 protein [Sinobacteraceae bacterium]|nr:glycosyltransferase family 39 protein [Nevskiaceae bacterium]